MIPTRMLGCGCVAALLLHIIVEVTALSPKGARGAAANYVDDARDTVVRMHPWPLPNVPALVPRPRTIELVGGGFLTASSFGSVLTMTSDLSDHASSDDNVAWLGEFEVTARGMLQGAATTGLLRQDERTSSRSHPPMHVTLSLLDTTDRLPMQSVDEHGLIQGPEAYVLEIRSDTLHVWGQRQGLRYGVQTAAQLLQRADGSLPALRIVDAPVYPYRGIMVDIARQPHSFQFHMDMLDRLAENKLNVYQLHASDDDGYALPSAAFPQLPLSTAMNMSEAKALQTKAASLGIEIVAEVDMPGHSSALLKNIPSLAAHNNVTGAPCHEINVSSPAVLATLQSLLDEVMTLFPSQWHHLGADEVQYNADCGMTKASYHHFINTMHKFVQARNKTMIVWEGFDPSPGNTAEVIDTSVVVSPFDAVRMIPWPHRPHHYYDAGYNILNTDWNPLYLVKGQNGFSASVDALAGWNPTKYGNYPYLGASVGNMQSLPQDNWQSSSYHSRFTGDNATCWPDSSQYSSSYIPSPFPSDRLLGGALCSWGNPEPVELPIFFGNCTGPGSMLPSGFDNSWPRPGPRGAVVGERFWAGALATSNDLLSRVNCSYTAPMPPPPPSPPPAPGEFFFPMQGACRDAQGTFSNRLDHGRTPLNFSDCRNMCIKLGILCDAFDIDGPMPPSGTDPVIPWCGIWGAQLTPADADPSLGFDFYASDGGRVCQGLPSAGKGNTCYGRKPLCNSTLS
eukprot:m.11179 g.11179  ORF g.11179 m.11179 type:complete len:736 (-) comp2827_c0_seq1:45-2252(-)